MKKKTFYKGTTAFLAMCMSFGAILPLNPSYVEAKEKTEQVEVQKNGIVSLDKNDTNFTFGNEYIKRTFSIANKKLNTTKVVNYRTGAASPTELVPQAGSEEFIINTLDNGSEEGKIKKPTKKIDSSNFTVEADSVATNEGTNGAAEKMFDSNDTTYYHSKYDGQENDQVKYPHNIYVDMGEEKSFKSVRYQQRLNNGTPTNGGRVENFKLYTADSLDALKTATDPVYEGKFDNQKETYVNLNKTVTAQFVRIEFTSGYKPSDNSNVNVASCSEFSFFEDEAIFPEKVKSQIKSSELTLKGEPVLTTKDDVKTLTFEFEPVTARGVEYTIKEIITMKDGDSFMRKHLEISVPAKDAAKAKIDYIDLENMNLADANLQENQYWTIPEQKDNPDMANMKGDYLELGQPYYLGAMYWGCEFPETENKIRDKNGFIRYHYGKSLAKDKHFEYHKNNTAGTMTTWDAVVGAARSTDYNVVQADFYEYIETIATDTEFRQQYNSWYDNMKNISDENILKSFYEIEKGFTQHGVNPLDSYVVDDGWINYSSFWDFNNKFPNELYNSSLQVNQLGSNFGLWLGPRGGYGTQGEIANWIERNGFGSVNRQSGDINISDARYLNKLRDDIFLGYQDKFDINYWKLDGMLLHPSTAPSEYYVTGSPFYTISETYERWTDLYEDMRENRKGKDLWINMTSYTNPSPWHLQWVNSVWMQNTGDTGYTNKFGNNDQQAMLTYRDNSYYNFLKERQWQLPHKYFYNHDPVYGLTANDAYNRPDIKFSDKELREHLFMLGTRGTAFWEYYYSYSMFDDNKWDINAEAAKWIEDNFDILQKSMMFGGKPENGDVYGYSCWNGSDGIVSLRNPSDKEKTYTIKYDRLIGVGENTKDVYGKVIIGDVAKYQNNNKLSYNDEITYTLQPKEVLIMQYGAQDILAAQIESIHANENKLEVTFNETLRTPSKEMFMVEGYNVTNVTLKEDRQTVELVLDKAVKDTSDVKVVVNGVQDTVGNATTATKVDDYYTNDAVQSIVNRKLDGTAINKGSKYSIDGSEGFSVTGVIKTESKGVEILRQEDSYSVGIDNDGYLIFTMGDVTANSKYVQKTVDRNTEGRPVTSETKGLIADGKEHQFTAVKEVNGMLKLYIDGEVVGSAYNDKNLNPKLNKADLVFADGLVGETAYITVVDHALAFDEVASFNNAEGNVASSKVNALVNVRAYDETTKTEISSKSDRPFTMINDGNKTTDNYLELTDTSDRKNHSRYVEFDLGAEYDLTKLHLTRYFKDNRTYGPTVIALSKDQNFTEEEVVFNTDSTGNVHKLGAGKDKLYQESAAGKDIVLENSVKARYIRLYVNGRDGNTSDHIVEFEAYGSKAEIPSISRIDYSRLETLVNEDLTKTYTAASIEAYNQAAKTDLEAAKELLANKNAKSDAQVEELVNKITKHRELLVKINEETNVDKTALEIAIELANKAKQDDQYKNVVDAVKAKFEASLTAANTVNKKVDATQAEVDKAFDELAQALQMLSFIKGDVAGLKELIAKAETYQADDYTTESYQALQVAIAEAKEAIKDEGNALVVDVEVAKTKLQEAINNLVKVETIDKSKLQAFYDQVKVMEEAKYLPNTWTGFKVALDQAAEVLGKDKSSQEEVNTAYDALVKAYLNLRLKPNKDALKDLITRAESLNNPKLAEEIAQAKAIVTNENATDAQVKEAYTTLNAAIKDLKAGDKAVATGDNNVMTSMMSLAGLSIAGLYLSKKRKTK